MHPIEASWSKLKLVQNCGQNSSNVEALGLAPVVLGQKMKLHQTEIGHHGKMHPRRASCSMLLPRLSEVKNTPKRGALVSGNGFF